MEKKPLKGKYKICKKLPQPFSAIRNYLQKNGWNVVLIGGTRVVGSLSNKFNFHFQCDFSGSKKQ